MEADVALSKAVLSNSGQATGRFSPCIWRILPSLLSTLSFTSALDWVDGQRHALAALHPGKTRYPLYRRLCGHQERSGRMRNISPQPGLDPRTVQTVASCYTDWAIPAPLDVYKVVIFQRVKLPECEANHSHQPGECSCSPHMPLWRGDEQPWA